MDIQDYIEKFYPDYSRSNEIGEEMDLFIAVFEPEDMTEDSAAMRLHKSYSQEDHDKNIPLQDWQEQRINILETVILEMGKEII